MNSASTDGQTERWLPVVGEPRYLVSNLGRVWSWHSKRVLRGTTTPDGYKSYEFGGRPPNRRARQGHWMVLEAFVGPRPDGLYGCHNDGDPENNRLNNLRWDTAESNIADRTRHGRDPQRNKQRCPRGHLLLGRNLAPGAARAGRRGCRACQNAQSLALARIKRGHPPIDIAEYANRKYGSYMAPAPPTPSNAQSRAPQSPGNAVKTHCKRGHSLSGSNLWLVPGPNRREYRNCAACALGRARVRQAARRGVTLDLQAEADIIYQAGAA